MWLSIPSPRMLRGHRQMLGGVIEVQIVREAVEYEMLVYHAPDLSFAVGQDYPLVKATLPLRQIRQKLSPIWFLLTVRGKRLG